MIVFPVKSMSGMCVLPKAWPRSILAISMKGAMMSVGNYLEKVGRAEYDSSFGLYEETSKMNCGLND
jgi:hypothetical protein